MTLVGVLALQGDFAEHIELLHSMKVAAMEVRTLEDLIKVSALIIPGGESTVIAKFLEETGLGKEIIRRVRKSQQTKGKFQVRSVAKPKESSGLVVYGTCAGAILCARKAKGKNAPRPLGLIDITVDRNAYGTQADSFETSLKVKGLKESIDVSFIRAPRITKIAKSVEVLATYKGEPVLVRQGSVLVGTFHPEMRGEEAIHRMFLSM